MKGNLSVYLIIGFFCFVLSQIPLSRHFFLDLYNISGFTINNFSICLLILSGLFVLNMLVWIRKFFIGVVSMDELYSNEKRLELGFYIGFFSLIAVFYIGSIRIHYIFIISYGLVYLIYMYVLLSLQKWCSKLTGPGYTLNYVVDRYNFEHKLIGIESNALVTTLKHDNMFKYQYITLHDFVILEMLTLHTAKDKEIVFIAKKR